MVRLAVRKIAPFDDPEHQTVWFGDAAAVWYWSRARVAEAAGGLDASARLRGWMAEAVLIGDAPAADALELLETPSGMHGRAWRSGALVADRWWPSVPSARDWKAFARGAGFLAGSEPPAGRQAVASERPWTSASSRGLRWNSDVASVALRQSWIVLGAVAIATLGFQAGAITRALVSLSSIEIEKAELEAPLQQILQARQAAERDVFDTRGLMALAPRVDQSALLVEFASRMPAEDWALTGWRLLESGRLEVSLAMPASNVESVVSALEESPVFGGVQSTVAGSGDALTIEMAVETAELSEP